jgi:hypothetical protein
VNHGDRVNYGDRVSNESPGTPGTERRILISFDIDGTLEAGDPPGPVTFTQVAAAKARGYVVGSASDRTISGQRAIWRQAGIEVDFTCHKHRLRESTSHLNCQRMLHIGDTSVDEHYATLAGFEFRYAADLPATPDEWLSNPPGQAPKEDLTQ